MVPPERLFLSSPTSTPVSPFARLAQASNLLGRVIRHCNDETLEIELALEEITLLHNTTSSLLSLLTGDSDATMAFYNAAAICLR
jgi:hypothetical protein